MDLNMVELNGFNGEELSLQGKGKPINIVDEIDPANFVSTIDNDYFPMTPGAEYVYHADTEDGLEVIMYDSNFKIKNIGHINSSQ